MGELFVYGTLRHRPLIERLLGRPVAMRAARLPGHRSAPLPGRPYPGLVVDSGAIADGDIVTVDDTDLIQLDAFEGDDYARIAVRPVVGGDEIAADTYLLLERGLAGTGDWSLDAFVATHAARWVAGADPGSRHPDRPD